VNDLDKALDEVFSLWIRCKGSRGRPGPWSCVTCPIKFNPVYQMIQHSTEHMGMSSNLLDCSHFWGKGSSGFWTRWNDLCADPLCRACHQRWEKMKNPGGAYYEYKRETLGDLIFNFMDWLSKRVDPMHPQVKEFRLFELISRIGSRGYPTGWLFKKHGYLITGLPGGTK